MVELLKVYGTKENTVKYALKLIDALFIDKQDLQNADSKKIDEDPRVKAIYGTSGDTRCKEASITFSI